MHQNSLDALEIEGVTIPQFVSWREQALEDFAMYDPEGAFPLGGTEYYSIGRA